MDKISEVYLRMEERYKHFLLFKEVQFFFENMKKNIERLGDIKLYAEYVDLLIEKLKEPEQLKKTKVSSPFAFMIDILENYESPDLLLNTLIPILKKIKKEIDNLNIKNSNDRLLSITRKLEEYFANYNINAEETYQETTRIFGPACFTIQPTSHMCAQTNGEGGDFLDEFEKSNGLPLPEVEAPIDSGFSSETSHSTTQYTNPIYEEYITIAEYIDQRFIDPGEVRSLFKTPSLMGKQMVKIAKSRGEMVYGTGEDCDGPKSYRKGFLDSVVGHKRNENSKQTRLNFNTK